MSRSTPAKVAKPHDLEAIKQRRKALLDAVNPELFLHYTTLLEKGAAASRGHVVFWWNVGRVFGTVQRKYRGQGVKALAEALEISETDLRAAKRTHEVVPDQKALNELMSRVGPTGQPLNWGHVRRLVYLEDAERDAMTAETLVNGYTNDELNARLRKLAAGKSPVGDGEDLGPPPSVGGRPFQRPRNLASAFAKMGQMSQVLVKYGREVIGDGKALDTMLAELSPEAMPEVKTQIDRLLDQLCSARSVTADEIAYLEGLRNKLAGAPPALSVEDEEDEEEQDEEDEEQDEEDEEQDEEDEDDEDEGPAGSLPAGGPAARRASTAQPTIQASAARSRPAAAAAQPTARIRTTYKPKPKTTPVDKAIARMKEGLPLSGGKRAKRR